MSSPGVGMRSKEGTGADFDKVAVVMPVYNEAAVVGDVIRGLREHFRCVVAVDDGSSDVSAARCREAGAVVVRHAVNLGQGAALQTGLVFALRDPEVAMVVTFDSDGQHRVEDAIRLVDVLHREPGLDVALGSRFLDGTTQISTLKRLVLKVAAAQSNRSLGTDLTDAHNGLRAFRRSFAETLRIRQSGMAHASEIVTQIAESGAKYEEVPVTVLYTDYSKSKGQPLINGINIVFDLLVRRL